MITAIGLAHYERFKDVAVVARTKFEIATATVARGGRVVVTDDVLARGVESAGAAGIRESLVVCGAREGDELRVSNIRQGREGVACDVIWDRRAFTLRAPLYGLHHAENIALAFAAAVSLGLDAERCELGVADDAADCAPAGGEAPAGGVGAGG